MNILFDTSVWIDHFRSKNPHIVDVISTHRVFIHPFVIGELSCGSFKNRSEILNLLNQLPIVTTASHPEVLEFIEKHKLYGTGIGYIDLHLLISCMLTDCAFWTLDKNLSDLQKKFKVPSGT